MDQRCVKKWIKTSIISNNRKERVVPFSVVANVQNCCIVGSEFELSSRYYAHFRINTLEKGMNLVIPPAMG